MEDGQTLFEGRLEDGMDPRARLLRLMGLLQSGRAWAAEDLAKALGTTTRTVRRDVQFLREQGYQVHSAPGPGGFYRFSSGQALPPLVLDDEEAVAAALGLRLAESGSLGVSLAPGAAERALSKLRAVLPLRLRERTDALIAAVQADTAQRPLPAAETLRHLAAAVAAHQVVRFQHAAAGAARTRHVEPHRLIRVASQWYLFAWDLDRADWRSFRLDRITGAVTTEGTYRPRELPAPDLAAYVAHSFTEPLLHEVVLVLNASTDEAATRLHRVDGRLEPLSATTCRYTAVVDSLEWMAMVMVVSEVQFTVIGPPAFAHYVRAAGTRFIRATGADR